MITGEQNAPPPITSGKFPVSKSSAKIPPIDKPKTASAFSGGADQLFGKQKARGFEAVMQRATAVLGAIWMILLFVLSFLSSK